ncbi:MAG: hypothetical protein A2Y16_03190 [Tenericutes bacterium GWF2_57_13]|nr:MAG: hypothetical protein A2Y16_03190 [Tenericutes bacterium GWF2_57_13]
MATRDEIVEFLRCAHAAQPPNVINTAKNRETRFRLGITIDDQKRIIGNLVADDYLKGPEPDRDQTFPGDVWIFKRVEFNTTFYIKLKLIIRGDNTNLALIAISCHIDNLDAGI